MDRKLDRRNGVEVRRFLTFKLNRLHAKLNAQATEVLRRHAGIGLSQWRILSLLYDAGETTPAALVSEADLDKGLCSRNLKTLVERELVISQRDPHDRRRQLIKLSCKGEELVTRTLPTMEARQAHLLDSLDQDERAKIYAIIAKLEYASVAREFT